MDNRRQGADKIILTCFIRKAMNKELLMVSVLIPAYNAQEVISKCLDSIIAQTYSNIEIVVVNDGSKDHTQEILNGYKNKTDNIIVIEQENKGCPVSRRNCIMASSGEFVVFVDADDYLDHDAITLLIDKQKNTDADVVLCGYYRCSENYTIDMTVQSGEGLLDSHLYVGDMLSSERDRRICGMLYRRSIMNDIHFYSDMQYGEDLFANIQILLTPNIKMAFVNKPLYYYVQMSNSLSSMKIDIDFIKKSVNIVKDIIDTKIADYNILIIYKFDLYLKYINRLSNLSVADNEFIKQLYREICGDSDNIRLIKNKFGEYDYLIFILHRNKKTAILGKILTRIKRTYSSINKRIKGN